MNVNSLISPTGSIILTARHIEVLRDVWSFSRIKRYHGMLPVKEAAVYDEGVVEALEESGLVERGVIFTTCGSHMEGFRLAEEAQLEFKELGLDYFEKVWDRVKETQPVAEDGLSRTNLDTLSDVYHLSKVKLFGGMAPKWIMDKYDKSDIKFLYDAGYLLYLKVKGSDMKSRKGYILTERSLGLLRSAGLIDT